MDFVDVDCSKEDLECFLAACEEEELYTYCHVIHEKLLKV
jgi:hypothetical protein